MTASILLSLLFLIIFFVLILWLLFDHLVAFTFLLYFFHLRNHQPYLVDINISTVFTPFWFGLFGKLLFLFSALWIYWLFLLGILFLYFRLSQIVTLFLCIWYKFLLFVLFFISLLITNWSISIECISKYHWFVHIFLWNFSYDWQIFLLNLIYVIGTWGWSVRRVIHWSQLLIMQIYITILLAQNFGRSYQEEYLAFTNKRHKAFWQFKWDPQAKRFATAWYINILWHISMNSFR